MGIGCSLSVSTSAVGFIVFPDPSADPATMGRDACLLFEALVGRILIVRKWRSTSTAFQGFAHRSDGAI